MAVNLSITHDYLVPTLSFSVSMSSGNSNLNLASVTSNFGLGFRQLDGTAAQKFEIPSKHDTAKKKVVD